MLEDENKKDLESYSLQYLRYYLGIYKKEKDIEILPHDAMGDVVVLKNLFEYLQNNSVLTPENMMTISKEPQYINKRFLAWHLWLTRHQPLCAR